MSFNSLIYIIVHLDKYIIDIISKYGFLTYLFVFLIILGETGTVIAPFLPGDSLLFIMGTLAYQGNLSVVFLFYLLSAAAILGDSLNYWIGKHVGDKILLRRKIIKQEHIDKTNEFYKKHGGITIVIARFLPIVRTFAPFIAGIGEMDYIRFLGFNIIGGVLWVATFLFTGYFFGSIPFVRNNLSLMIVLVVVFSFIFPAYQYILSRFKKH